MDSISFEFTFKLISCINSRIFFFFFLQRISSSSKVLQGSSLHKCAVACVYACNNSSQLQKAAASLLDALPITNDRLLLEFFFCWKTSISNSN